MIPRLLPSTVLSICVALLAFGSVAQTQTANIKAVITAQLDAFKENDLERAFSFASPMIKQMFQNPRRFGMMVQEGYPMVWRPADVRFGSIKEVDGATYQIVFFTDRNGRVFEAAYEMERGDIGWKINGVFIREAALGA